MTADTLTVARAVDGAFLAKRIARHADGSFGVKPYDSARWFAVDECPVDGIIALGRLLARLGRDPRACILPAARCRASTASAAGAFICLTSRTMAASRRRASSPPREWLALDFDRLPCPVWVPEDLARRRAALARDRREHPRPTSPPKGPDDGEDYDPAADEDPAPIDPVHESGAHLRVRDQPPAGRVRERTLLVAADRQRRHQAGHPCPLVVLARPGGERCRSQALARRRARRSGALQPGAAPLHGRAGLPAALARPGASAVRHLVAPHRRRAGARAA